ncbi:MAG: endonuclease III [Magnetococcales bacterium]|nr:endonuclease III [Magnetococcales bacterium]MBF0155584.1 endonuclease III [Magnetococcales bacterium]
MNAQEVAELFSALERANPAPASELRYGNPFELLVAVVLSAQSTDVGVNRVTPALFRAAPNPAALASLGEAAIRDHIRSLGLFNTKARNLANLATMLVDRFGGEVPNSREALESLPGVGRKSANVVLNVAFGQETLAVDTHVFRVANRTGLAEGKSPEAVEKALLAIIPPPFRRNAHHWLVLHGRHVCRARQPRCAECVIATWCQSAPPPCDDRAGSAQDV